MVPCARDIWVDNVPSPNRPTGQAARAPPQLLPGPALQATKGPLWLHQQRCGVSEALAVPGSLRHCLRPLGHQGHPHGRACHPQGQRAALLTVATSRKWPQPSISRKGHLDDSILVVFGRPRKTYCGRALVEPPREGTQEVAPSSGHGPRSQHSPPQKTARGHWLDAVPLCCVKWTPSLSAGDSKSSGAERCRVTQSRGHADPGREMCTRDRAFPNNPLTIQPSDPTSGYRPKRIVNGILKRYWHPRVHCNVVHKGQNVEAT